MRFSILNSNAERREGLKTLVRQIDRRARFSDAHDWRQAERALRRQKPDLLVIDWEDWMSLADLRKLLSQHPAMPVAVLTDEAPLSWVRALVDEGVLGVIPRNTNPTLIVRALEIVLLGGHYVPACALNAAALRQKDGTNRLFDPFDLGAKRMRPLVNLSPRQEQILRCVHMGSTNKVIARTLGISEGTVKIHLTSIFQQLGAPNRAAAVAIYNGWLAAQLEVLRSNAEPSSKPVHGEHGVVPLRRPNSATKPRFTYSRPLTNGAIVLPMAAEPTVQFGKTTSTDDSEEPDAA